MYTLSPLAYPYESLEPYIDTETMHIHHDKHHATYVKNLNDLMSTIPVLSDLPVEELLRRLSEVPEAIRQKVTNNAGGHANHALYWDTLGGPHDQEPTGKLLAEIVSTFGSVDMLKEKMTAAAIGRFGSGWSWLAVENGKLSVLDTANQDSPILKGMTPLFGIDVWEHAYYLKFRNVRADYVSALWHVVNWSRVGERYLEAIG